MSDTPPDGILIFLPRIGRFGKIGNIDKENSIETNIEISLGIRCSCFGASGKSDPVSCVFR